MQSDYNENEIQEDNLKKAKEPINYYKQMNLKETPIEIFGDSSSVVSNDYSVDNYSVKSNKPRKEKNRRTVKEKTKKTKRINPISNNLNIIEEEVKSGMDSNEESRITKNNKNNTRKMTKKELEINKKFINKPTQNEKNFTNANIPNLNQEHKKVFKDNFKKILTIDDF